MKQPGPTQEEMLAEVEISQRFFEKLNKAPIKMNDAERELFLFSAGFHRGAAWQRENGGSNNEPA